MCFRPIVLIALLISHFIFLDAGAQGLEKEYYQVYLEQVTRLLKARGLDDEEIRKALAVYRENNIRSDRDFASLLNKIYPVEKGILFIFYHFHHDTLRRVVFEPGSIHETKYFRVSAAEIRQLGTDFNHVLGLYQGTNKRMPKQRGAIIKPPPPSKGITYDSLVRKATRLLLPDWFSKSWKHLVIIPALNIGTLPFHLLRPYGDATSLLDHCSFTVAPGAGDLVALRMKILKMASDWNGKLLLPFNLNQDLRIVDSLQFRLENPLFISNPAYPTNTAYEFPDLPGARKEIDKAIPFAEKYRLLQGKEARKDSVLKYIGEANVAYFATHGVADAEDPMRKSFLVLSGRDPFLTAKDIMDTRSVMKRFPEMVILSACQTGLGKSMEAGVAGLARSFLLAGANHVIMSLWNVDDEATAYLMNRFLFHLQSPSRFMPAEPLRRAMLDTRERFPKPSQWASFSLFGVSY